MSAVDTAVFIILSTVQAEPKTRTDVTNELRRYRKAVRHQAVSYVMNNRLVKVIKADWEGKGRPAMLIKITEKGLKHLADNPRSTTDTVWK